MGASRDWSPRVVRVRMGSSIAVVISAPPDWFRIRSAWWFPAAATVSRGVAQRLRGVVAPHGDQQSCLVAGGLCPQRARGGGDDLPVAAFHGHKERRRWRCGVRDDQCLRLGGVQRLHGLGGRPGANVPVRISVGAVLRGGRVVRVACRFDDERTPVPGDAESDPLTGLRRERLRAVADSLTAQRPVDDGRRRQPPWLEDAGRAVRVRAPVDVLGTVAAPLGAVGALEGLQT